MDKQIRILSLVFFSLVGLITFSGIAYAEGPDSGGSTTVQSIFERLEASDDPQLEFAELSIAEQEAVIEHSKVASVSKDHTFTISGSAAINGAVGASEKCGTNEYTLVALNNVGWELYTYSSRTDWCWDGTYITSDPFFTRDAHVINVLWEFVGHTDRNEWGGRGDRVHRDYTEGHFRACIGLRNIGCIQNKYPDIDKAQFGDGTYHKSGSE